MNRNKTHVGKKKFIYLTFRMFRHKSSEVTATLLFKKGYKLFKRGYK